MGAYTNVIDYDVKIVDKEGLLKFISEIKEGKLKEYEQHKYLVDGIEIEGENLSFQGMDGWKIISYWYKHFAMFLRDLAVFVEGQVYLEFESSDEGGWFEFHNGKCIIHTGVMQWTESTPEDFEDLPPLSLELQKRLIARKI